MDGLRYILARMPPLSSRQVAFTVAVAGLAGLMVVDRYRHRRTMRHLFDKMTQLEKDLSGLNRLILESEYEQRIVSDSTPLPTTMAEPVDQDIVDDEASSRQKLDEISKKSLATGGTQYHDHCFQLAGNYAIKYNSSAKILWRVCRVFHLIASLHNQTKERSSECSEIAYEIARQALHLDDQSANVLKWYAITVETKADLTSYPEKIKYLDEVRSYLKQAIDKSEGKDGHMYSLLGSHYYEVNRSDERAAAAIRLMGGESLFVHNEQIEEVLRKAISLGYSDKVTNFYLYKCLSGRDGDGRSMELLKNASEAGCYTEQEFAIQRSIDDLMSGGGS